MYHLEYIISGVERERYCRDFRDVDRFLALCLQCKNYNSVWSCPNFEDSSIYSFDRFGWGYIIGTRVVLDPDVRYRATNESESMDLTREILMGVRSDLDKRLLELEAQFEGSRAFFGGSCCICPRGECARVEGSPCRYPQRMRNSLESLGFDLAKTSSEILNVDLKWNDGFVLPEYFVLISAIFTPSRCEALENVTDIYNL